MARASKQCIKCGEIKTHSRGKGSPCDRCHFRDLKTEAVNFLGGQCSKCGYAKCNSALSFHHREPHKKSERLSRMFSRVALARVLNELSSCILLCMNCHMELHANEVF